MTEKISTQMVIIGTFLFSLLIETIDFCFAPNPFPLTSNCRIDSLSLTRKSTVVCNKILPNVSDASVAASRRDARDEVDNERNNSARHDKTLIRSGNVKSLIVNNSQK